MREVVWIRIEGPEPSAERWARDFAARNQSTAAAAGLRLSVVKDSSLSNSPSQGETIVPVATPTTRLDNLALPPALVEFIGRMEGPHEIVRDLADLGWADYRVLRYQTQAQQDLAVLLGQAGLPMPDLKERIHKIRRG